jgi:CRISPR system Cascade subunit CasA
MTPSFDLVDSPWIPCIDAAGRRVELGLRDTLVRAHELTEVRDESPLTTAALLRLLMAVLYAALEGPKDERGWRALWKAGAWSEGKIGTYLKTWRQRFELFDAKHPFLQVGGFEITGKEGSPVTKLTHQLATGNSATLFDHTVEEREVAVAPAVAARWLVTCQSFAVGGGVGATSNKFGKHPNFTHAPMVGGVAVFLQGKTLFETLALNLVPLTETSPMPTRGQDKPTWEQDRVDAPEERRPRGVMEFLTWRARMVRLLPELRGESTVVARMHFASGWATAGGVVNPAWAYVADEKRGIVPVGLRQGRALWRDSSALLTAMNGTDGVKNLRPAALNLASSLVSLEILPANAALRVLSLGFANDKAKVLLWRRETWSVPARLLEDAEVAMHLLGALQDADVGGKAMYAALSRFKECFKDGFAEVRDRGMAAYWGGLETSFREFVSDVAADPEKALAAWRAELVRSSKSSLDRATDNTQRRSARELRARVEAQGLLASKLQPLTNVREETHDGDVRVD